LGLAYLILDGTLDNDAHHLDGVVGSRLHILDGPLAVVLDQQNKSPHDHTQSWGLYLIGDGRMGQGIQP
jgi:hypothetical protein